MSYYKQTVSAESEVLLDDKVLTETTAGVGNSFILSDKTIDVSDIPVGSGYRIYYQIGCPSIMNPVSFQVTITGVASCLLYTSDAAATETYKLHHTKIKKLNWQWKSL